MKEKPSEWVAISDLMAGVMAIVMLLLVVSVLQSNYSEIEHQQEIQKSISAQKLKLSSMLSQLMDSFLESGADNIISVDMAAGRITLKDSVFSRGSACITDEARYALKLVEKRVDEFLSGFEKGKIVIEGHTDSIPVLRPVTDYIKFCTVYDDNYTLSAARAREARNLVIGVLSGDKAKRVIVAGYGDSHPVAGLSTTDAANRRVETNFMINESLTD